MPFRFHSNLHNFSYQNCPEVNHWYTNLFTTPSWLLLASDCEWLYFDTQISQSRDALGRMLVDWLIITAFRSVIYAAHVNSTSVHCHFEEIARELLESFPHQCRCTDESHILWSIFPDVTFSSYYVIRQRILRPRSVHLEPDYLKK
jgi:hypothetical protein